MFYRLSEIIAEKFEIQQVISKEEKEIYRYGVQQGLNLLLNLLTTILIGVLVDMFLESIIFLGVYMPLRSYAGGFHAKTHMRCYFYSIFMITAILLVIKKFPLGFFICSCLSLSSGLFIFLLAPIETENKKLDNLEIQVYKKKTRIILICEIIIQFLFGWLPLSKFCMCFSLAFVSLSFIMLVGIIKNKYNEHLLKI